jgi:hypothetical protein
MDNNSSLFSDFEPALWSRAIDDVVAKMTRGNGAFSIDMMDGADSGIDDEAADSAIHKTAEAVVRLSTMDDTEDSVLDEHEVATAAAGVSVAILVVQRYVELRSIPEPNYFRE